MKSKFNTTHHGLMYGIVPVRLDMTIPSCPDVEAKGGIVGDIFLDVCEFIFGICVFIMTAINPGYEPMFPIKVLRKEKK